MERDSRRDRGQWKGCYTFKDITCEGDAGSVPKRDGGLRMGHTYYYYYEVDGASETHDPSQPSTTTCPYLPGQTVNTLFIPVEQSLRKRSASLTSLRDTDFKTMDPASKFISPRPAPAPPAEASSSTARRLGTAPFRLQNPHQQQQMRPSRSPSPSSRWHFSARKLFSRKSSSSSLREMQTPPQQAAEDARSLRSEGSRSRDISPESLRRFLVDETPLPSRPDTAPTQLDAAAPSVMIDIPDDIAEELEDDDDDDDNFATSAVSETMHFTGLSPPPTRSLSPARTVISVNSDTEEDQTLSFNTYPAAPTRPAPLRPVAVPTNRAAFPLSAFNPYPPELESPADDETNSPPGFDLSDADVDDDLDDDDVDIDTVDAFEQQQQQQQQQRTQKRPAGLVRHISASLSTYSLPRTAAGGTEADANKLRAAEGKETTAATRQERSAVPGPLMLTSPIPDAGLGELVSELGWVVGQGVRF
ncbi:hypothetical protein B0J18DRAFT_409863 [Chaetomium sp. MPI-SDFR-AT-0129]|nr:hypothetical protein B0J18DRAFT_409863 [Chaetomium sp. MPI-SDFR-AT-0129]